MAILKRKIKRKSKIMKRIMIKSRSKSKTEFGGLNDGVRVKRSIFVSPTLC